MNPNGIRSLLFVLTVCCLFCSDLVAQQATLLRILSYNIHHGEGVDGQIDLERIARVILSVDPDIVALQEVDQDTRRTNQVDQPASLSGLTKMQVVFGHNIPWEGGLYGNAVLTRLPVIRSENHPLPSFYDGERRGVLELEVQPPGDQLSILIFAMHLDYRKKSEERLASARVVNDLVASRANTPALLVGDLNDEPCSGPILEFGKHWQRANGRILPTYPARCPFKQIDYVMFRPRNNWRVIYTQVLNEQIASDHRAVLAVLELHGQ